MHVPPIVAPLIDQSAATDHSSHSQGEKFIQVADNIIKPVPKKKATQPLDMKQWTKAFICIWQSTLRPMSRKLPIFSIPHGD